MASDCFCLPSISNGAPFFACLVDEAGPHRPNDALPAEPVRPLKRRKSGRPCVTRFSLSVSPSVRLHCGFLSQSSTLLH
ncbi:hypothetical protein BO83DRAFT_232371 [Aspergillus eucalypticola CBS 122712]|uniref:Uncharacterized protein n=1 Tax=Aspergillus eucalypticola (strain CBS 122712 / IBT 29274) TaxID=1448314 RepID=A0A317VQ95_ASPEC|nr:uncharacterized protein BO83DRAFT_232371 [Aspergillus eucalypticola CBS 122712]PWY76544.1 hypothetical protein BO83DRAFT_232371 [Aspergillus eucalypticola CBS 122712]